MIMLRKAHSLHDFDIVLFGAGEFAKLVNRPDLFPEPGSPQMRELVEKLFWTPGFAVLLYEHGGELAGGIGFWIGPFLMNVGKIEWQEIFWWAAPGAPASVAMRLLFAAKNIGKEAGATIFTAHSLLSSPAGVDKAYRTLGLTPLQTTYMGIA